ncbi:Cysteine--tRNA ligase [Candidatus Providencia siddallii]|uniref:Cysteine--tRNA ligase n=1 Tax=Candidatus Providencia siddallii TaxID=1715285 RepID=A0A0M6W6S5_9GAMM|nr:Cysteine--tRNA ligase [Candidatus Providencia siddallii]
MLQIFNTLTRKKDIFNPIHGNKVGMYVCGVTAYDLCHIGHARTFITFDVVSRYLRYLGYKLTYVRNITDIDDKIIQRAAKNNESIKELTTRMSLEMHKDFNSLNILYPDKEPFATNYINEIIDLIQVLINNGHSYIAKNGDVMFDIKTDPNYGVLSKQKLNQLQIGCRVKSVKIKRNDIDFVLWKTSKEMEPSWKSPWGAGRPGWHIECSAINNKILGKHFDIHGGGSDLVFPHHENEISQSICANSFPYVNYWMHSGMVTINGEKMSKSLNKFITIRDAVKLYDPETIRYFLLSAHYRSELNFTENSLMQAHMSLMRLYIALRGTDKNTKSKNNGKFKIFFNNAMNDDFNTPVAYSVLFDIAREINKLKSKNMIYKANIMAAQLRELAGVLGLLESEPELFLKSNIQITDDSIEFLIKQRDYARKIKNWKLADIIRSKLMYSGVLLEDGKRSTLWRRK